MAKKDEPKDETVEIGGVTVTPVQAESPGKEALLAGGYDMTAEDAQLIIDEWGADHSKWPLAEYRKARAFLDNLKATPRVIARKPAWRRSRDR